MPPEASTRCALTQRPSSELLDFDEDGFAFCLVLAVGEDHVGAIVGEFQSSVATQAAAAAGDEGDFAGVLHSGRFGCAGLLC